MVSDGEKGTLGEAAGPASPAAHCAQNFARGGLSAPHDGHLSANGAAHSIQNLALSGFSAPHFVHFTPIPLETESAELRANLTKARCPNLHLHHRREKQSRHGADRKPSFSRNFCPVEPDPLPEDRTGIPRTAR
jgi:hypothetical protein